MGIRPSCMPPGSVPEQPGNPRSAHLSGLCGKSRPVPACKSCPGRSGETYPVQQKSHGAFTLHGLDWFGDLLGGDAGGCGQLLLSLLGLERIPAPALSGLCGESRPVPACKSCTGRSAETSPAQQKSHGALCSMALIGLGNYSMAMRVDAGSSC